jgi:hypothetical protein
MVRFETHDSRAVAPVRLHHTKASATKASSATTPGSQGQEVSILSLVDVKEEARGGKGTDHCASHKFANAFTKNGTSNEGYRQLQTGSAENAQARSLVMLLGKHLRRYTYAERTRIAATSVRIQASSTVTNELEDGRATRRSVHLKAVMARSEAARKDSIKAAKSKRMEGLFCLYTNS